MTAARQLTREEAIASLWRAGDLSYLLLPHQEPVREAICKSKRRKFVLNIARRWGKSMLLCVLAVEMCLQKPGANVRYAAGTSEMVEEIIEPHMQRIFEDAPPEFVPEYNTQKKRWVFPNGSSIRVAGCDDTKKADRLRGRACDLAIIDEAGFIDCLDYVISSVLMPQLMTVDGRMLISSTPAASPAHPFTRLCAEAAANDDSYVHRTIEDASHISEEVREEFIAEAGGRDSSTCRRELYAENVTDESRAVYPEFMAARPFIVEEVERAPYYDAYVVGDAGFHDLTVLLFAWWDFEHARIVIEDELVMRRKTSRVIDDACAAKERELWGEHPVYARAIDAPPIVIAELASTDRPWNVTRKDDLDASVNAARLALYKKTVRIHPRCKVLLAHLEYAIWNNQRTDFVRPKETEHDDRSGVPIGHFDGAAAFHYLVRRIEKHRNPYPRLADGVTHADHWIPPELRQDPKHETIKRLFGRGRAA